MVLHDTLRACKEWLGEMNLNDKKLQCKEWWGGREFAGGNKVRLCWVLVGAGRISAFFLIVALMSSELAFSAQ